MPIFALLAALILLTGPSSQPKVIYGTYLGGRNKDIAAALTIDSVGNAWVVGSTPSPDFPVTRGAFKTEASVNNDDSVGFATKLNTEGNNFLYSTFLGGSWRSSANAIAVDSSGVVIVGSTCSPDFPVTENALQRRPGGGGQGLDPCDGYVVKLDGPGSRVIYATYFGGPDADTVNSVAIDNQGRAVVAGWTRSQNLFGTTGRGASDAFVAALAADGSLLWIKRFGGSGADWFASLAVARDGTIWATGVTDSPDFRCDRRLSGTGGFVIRIVPGKAATCLGLAGEPTAIALDVEGRAYVCGSVVLAGRRTGFVAKLSSEHVDWYTHVGGSDETRISGITAGLPGSVIVCGSSYSRDFPVTRGALKHYPGEGSDMVLLRLSATGDRVVYGTFLGGNAASDIAPLNNTAVAVQADSAGSVWIAGNAIGHPAWITPHAAQRRNHGNTDTFVLKLKML